MLAKVIASRTKQLVLTFFDNRVIVYTITVNADYMYKWVQVPAGFPGEQAPPGHWEWFLQLGQCTAPHAQSVLMYLVKNPVQLGLDTKEGAGGHEHNTYGN